MNRSRRFANLILSVLAILLVCIVLRSGSDAQVHRSNSRPNIVIILADDLGYGDPGCYNPESKIPTPNIDRLAKQGMQFTDAHTASAVCTPTRYALLTGRYCWRTKLKRGVLEGYAPLLIEPGRPTIASFLKSQGYTTAGFGKWHLGLGTGDRTDYNHPINAGPTTVGFDSYFGIPSSLDFPPYLYLDGDSPVEAPSSTIAASASQKEGGGGFWRAGAIAPSFKHQDVLPKITERAVDFIRSQSAGKPFFLYLALPSPHTPWMPLPEYKNKSGAGWYGDYVVETDDMISRVLKALDDRQLAQDTLLVFTSDNGGYWQPSDIAEYGHRSNGSWRGQKADIWEGGHRVPFIVRWPGQIRPYSRCGQTIGLIDLFATFADVLGETLQDDAAEDSFSILPLLRGSNKPVRESVIHHSGDGMFAIRAGKWKLVESLGSGGFTPPASEKQQPGGPSGQLYDLAEDPGEQRNLYLSKPADVARLTALLNQTRDSGRSRPTARPVQ